MRQKQTPRANEWKSEAVFQPGEKWVEQNLLPIHKYKLIFAALHNFPNDNPWV